MTISEADLARGRAASSILACGTSWHAGLVGKFLIEQLARLPVEVDYGSEYRYRNPIVGRPDARGRHHAVGRDGRHAGRAARGEAQGRAQHRDLQRRRQHGDARERRHRLHARRARRSASRRPRRSPRSSSRCYLLALHLAQVRGTLDAGRSRARTSTACCSCRRCIEQTLRVSALVDEIAAPLLQPHATSCTSAAASTTRSRSRARSS